MDWFFKIVTIWLSIDIIVITTFWYLSITIPRFWPTWWREVVVGALEPDFRNNYLLYAETATTAN